MSEPVSRAPRWERRKESRPAELVAAALDLFVERGYAATRLDDVATRAGVSKGTLYLYFDSKEELFKAVVREHIVPLIEESQRSLERPGASCADLVRRYLRQWWDRFGATALAGIAKLIVAEAGNFPEVAAFFQREVIAPNGAVLEALIRRGIDAGEFRDTDPKLAAHFCVAPLVLQAIWTRSMDALCADDARIDPRRFLDAHIEYAIAALTAPPSEGSAR